jgi:proteasome lid subunit RPN8/RPN11
MPDLSIPPSKKAKGTDVLPYVYMEEATRNAIDAHVSTDTSVESGGVLVGLVDEAAHQVYITASIPAHRAKGTVASLTFTHEAWDDIDEIMSRDFENYRMVGWYHSHPRFGIFLSDYDMFIQSNFFAEPWQVAYVVDPVLKTSGFFGWDQGEVVRNGIWTVVARGGEKPVREPDRGDGVPSPSRSLGPPITVSLGDGGPPPPPGSALANPPTSHGRHGGRPNLDSKSSLILLLGLVVALVLGGVVGSVAFGGRSTGAAATSTTIPKPGFNTDTTEQCIFSSAESSSTCSANVAGSAEGNSGPRLTETASWFPGNGQSGKLYVFITYIGGGSIPTGTVSGCAPTGWTRTNSPSGLGSDDCPLKASDMREQFTSEAFVFVPGQPNELPTETLYPSYRSR